MGKLQRIASLLLLLAACSEDAPTPADPVPPDPPAMVDAGPDLEPTCTERCGPPPANGVTTCPTATSCDFDCREGFVKTGAACTAKPVPSCIERCGDAPENGVRVCPSETECSFACLAGHVRVGDRCLKEDAEHCGPAAIRCEAPMNGRPMCVRSQCTFDCAPNYRPMSSTCVPWKLQGKPDASPLDFELEVKTTGEYAIAYTSNLGTLRYEESTYGYWPAITTDMDRSAGLSLALTPANVPVMVYSLRTARMCMMSIWNGTAWESSSVGRLCQSPVLRVGTNGTFHLIYSDPGEGLRYMRRVRGTSAWTLPVTVTSLRTGDEHHLDVSDSGNLGVVFSRDYKLYYTALAAGETAWPAAEFLADGKRPHLALDGTIPHVSFYRPLELQRSEIWYATRRSSGWKTTRVSQRDVASGYANAIRLAGAGRPCIATVAGKASGADQHAQLSCLEPANWWRHSLLTSVQAVELDIDLAFDTQQNPVLTYAFSQSTAGLLIAR